MYIFTAYILYVRVYTLLYYYCVIRKTRALLNSAAAAAKSLVVYDSVRPHRWQPTGLPRPWDSPGKNTGVGCHFLGRQVLYH